MWLRCGALYRIDGKSLSPGNDLRWCGACVAGRHAVQDSVAAAWAEKSPAAVEAVGLWQGGTVS